jgi:hypothetical protein
MHHKPRQNVYVLKSRGAEEKAGEQEEQPGRCDVRIKLGCGLGSAARPFTLVLFWVGRVASSSSSISSTMTSAARSSATSCSLWSFRLNSHWLWLVGLFAAIRLRFVPRFRNDVLSR